MAKAMNSAQKATVKSFKVAQTAKNKAARLNRHLKRHENDKQAGAVVGKARTLRKAPLVNGSAPRANRDKAYRDDAGHTLGAPMFQTVVKATK